MMAAIRMLQMQINPLKYYGTLDFNRELKKNMKIYEQKYH
jgi:sensor histidine kinase YesM